MIKRNKWKLLISSLLLILPAAVALLFPQVIADKFSIIWNGTDTADMWSSPFSAFVILPLVLLALHWLCVLFTLLDKKSAEQNERMLGIVLWITPATSFLVLGILYLAANSGGEDITKIIFPFMGVLFMVLGNIMPKVRQNYSMGIKVKWALEDEKNWYATHRLVGKLWVGLGLYTLILIFIPIEIGLILFLAGVAAAVTIPTVYSYRFYKNKVAEGREMKSTTQAPKEIKVVAAVIAIAAVLGAGALLISGDFDVTCTDTQIVVEARMCNDMSLNYTDIKDVYLAEKAESAKRTMGYGSPKLSMGLYQNEAYGNHTRYKYAESESGIIITTNDDKIIVLSGKNDTVTESIYNNIIKHIAQ